MVGRRAVVVVVAAGAIVFVLHGALTGGGTAGVGAAGRIARCVTDHRLPGHTLLTGVTGLGTVAGVTVSAVGVGLALANTVVGKGALTVGRVTGVGGTYVGVVTDLGCAVFTLVGLAGL